MSAGVATTQPLALGSLLNGWGMPAGAFSVPITPSQVTLELSQAGAAVYTTVPLSLGMTLYTSGFTIAASPLTVPVVMKAAALVASSSGADIGTGWPLILGLTLGTSGTTNYTVTAASFAVPITPKDAALSSSTISAEIQTTYPLALGMLLNNVSYSLLLDTFGVQVNLAPSTQTEFEGAEPPATDFFGGVKRGNVFPRAKKRKKEPEVVLKPKPPERIEEVMNFWTMLTAAEKALAKEAEEIEAKRRKRRRDELTILLS